MRIWGALFSVLLIIRPMVVSGLAAESAKKPTLVVGATGRVGRRVVQQLIGANKPVRALVRNAEKSAELFGTRSKLEYPKLDIVVADIAKYEDYEETLDKAVEGCSSIISVSGSSRFSKITDFLPWRLFKADVSSWAGRDHPYYANYLGQKKLIELAEKHGVSRFVRLTGLSLSLSAFNPVTILFNSLLSLTSRYHFLCERALADSKLSYVVLRPGGLAEDVRDRETTNVQIAPSGELPVPGRIGRDDVAALSIAACEVIPPGSKSYTLACRCCGEVKPKPQGVKEDGHATAEKCMEKLVQSGATSPVLPTKMKPYSLAVGVAAYSFFYLVSKGLLGLWALASKLIRG